MWHLQARLNSNLMFSRQKLYLETLINLYKYVKSKGCIDDNDGVMTLRTIAPNIEHNLKYSILALVFRFQKIKSGRETIFKILK